MKILSIKCFERIKLNPTFIIAAIWLPIASCIKFKVLLLVSKSQFGLAPTYLTDFMRKPMSSTSARPLSSADRLEIFVPRVRTALAQCRAFAVVPPLGMILSFS